MTINDCEINEFDLYNLPEDFIDNSYEYYNALREKDPVYLNPDGSYIVTSHKDLVDIYRNHDVWSSDKKAEFKPKFGNSPLFEHHTSSVVFTDPPAHTRIRKIFQHAFTPKALINIENDINKLVGEYVNEIMEKNTFNFVSDFSFRLPVDVVCNVLGVPKTDRSLIRDWAREILGALEPTLTENQFKNGCDAVNSFKDYLSEQVDFRKKNPQLNREGEVLSTLIDAKNAGIRLSTTELLHQCIFMLNAGHETSTNMLSHGINELIKNKDEFRLLRKDLSQVNTAVEEVLRFQPPIQINNRRSKKHTVIGNKTIPKGTSVHMIIPGGNRDPKQFDEPDKFKISRKPNRHLSFGLGIHICAGNSLARIEGRVAFGKIISEFRDINLVSVPKLAKRIRFREILELPLEFTR